jgi:sugar phosphate isomerase/epimerase
MTDPFVSTKALGANRLDYVFQIARRLDVRHIELSSSLTYEDNILSKINTATKEFQFLVHNYFPPARAPFLLNLASGNESIRQRSLNFVMQALDLCAQIGSPLYSVHCGFTFDGDGSQLGHANQLNLNRISMDEAMAKFIKSLAILMPVAEKLKINFAIENNVLAEFALIEEGNQLALGADASSLNYIFEQFNNDQLFLLLDLGHAKVNASTLGQPIDEMINLFHDRIIALHLSDNDGRNDLNWSLSYDSDLWPYIKMADTSIHVIEAHFTDEKTLKDQIRLLSELHANTKP